MYAKVIPSYRTRPGVEMFDYSIPKDLQDETAVGSLVNIPFRGRNIQGLVYSISEKTEIKGRILEIKSLILPFAPFTKDYIDLIDGTAEYYLVSRPALLKAMLPGKPLRASRYTPHEMPKIDFEKTGRKDLLSRDTARTLFIYSGRNELYGNIRQLLNNEEKGQAIILEPQIGFVNATARYLNKYFEGEVCFLHSQLSKTEYWKNWLDFVEGRRRFLVATRAGIFTPCAKLSAIIVNGEEFSDFKQYDQTPRYDARHIAAEIASKKSCQLIFSAESPRLTTWHTAQNNNWQIVKSENNEKPLINIIDIEDERRKFNFSLLSHSLENACQQALQNNKKVLLFFNRRGWASSILCRDCGYQAACRDCGLPYIAHKNRLICHHCGDEKPMALECPECRGANIKMVGAGTEKLESDIKKIFGNNRVLRLDKDNYRLDYKLSDYDIIIGTNLLLKDYYWQLDKKLDVGAVGIINADNLFNIPDYRSTEKAWQEIRKITNLSNRIGSDIYIQTRRPDNKVIKNLNNPTEFFKDEIIARKAFNYPPFSRLVKLIIQDPDQSFARDKTSAVYKRLEKSCRKKNIEILGPYASVPAKIRNRYRFLITLKLPPKESHGFLKKFLDGIIIDVDPEFILF